MTGDERRSARLLFHGELASGRLAPEAIEVPEVACAVHSRRVPRAPRRAVERVRMKAGRVTYAGACVQPFMTARRAVLGGAAAGAPRVLVRVDEFPHFRCDEPGAVYSAARFERFHAILAAAGVPYLLSALPRPSRRPLDPRSRGDRPMSQDEIDVLRAVAAEGNAIALHGLDHRTRHRSPRRRSELSGLDAQALGARVERGLGELAAAGIRPSVFVPPYNRFDASQYALLADRFDVVCGGPETVARLGFHRTPLWRGDAVFLPAYPPLYGSSADVLAGLEDLCAAGASVWAPVVLHWGVEADDGWLALERLVVRLASLARPWPEFLAAVEASR